MSLHTHLSPDLDDGEEGTEMIEFSDPLTERAKNSLKRRIVAALEAALNELIMLDAAGVQKL